MELVTMKLGDITPYAKNARKNDAAVDAVAESIRQCTYVAPIIVDEDGIILAGHTRWKAMRKLGKKEAEVLVKAGLTEEQKAKYRLLDNKTNELADWDYDLLGEELRELDFGDLDLDWGVKFDEPKEIEEDEVPALVEDAEPVARLGDVWQLGRHRLMCGSSLAQADIDKLLDGNKCELTFTDPPYQLETQGGGILKKANSMKQIKQNGVDTFDPSMLVLQSETNIY